MRHVEWLGRNVSAIGFGCANVGGRLSRRASLRALHTAFDAGITYFDVARSYGYGHAERHLGEFLVGRRDAVVVATKFGIEPPPPNVLRSLARPIVREAIRFSKWTGISGLERTLRRGIARGAGTSVRRGQFSPAIARASLETSLRELRCEYVDVLWLHDCQPDDLTDELLETLNRFIAEGKIRSYGPATDAMACREIVRNHPRIPVAQMPHHVLDDALPAADGRLTAIHSVLGTPEQRARLRTIVEQGIDIDGGLEPFAIRYALAANRNGVVILGMSNPQNIAANAAIASEPVTDATLTLAERIRQASRQTNP